MLDRAFRLNPRYPVLYTYFLDNFYIIGQYDKVVALVRGTPGDVLPWNYMLLAMALGQLGRPAEVEAAKADLRKSYPDFSMERLFSDFGGTDYPPVVSLYIDHLARIGLAGCATPADLRNHPAMKRIALCDAKRAAN